MAYLLLLLVLLFLESIIFTLSSHASTGMDSWGVHRQWQDHCQCRSDQLHHLSRIPRPLQCARVAQHEEEAAVSPSLSWLHLPWSIERVFTQVLGTQFYMTLLNLLFAIQQGFHHLWQDWSWADDIDPNPIRSLFQCCSLSQACHGSLGSCICWHIWWGVETYKMYIMYYVLPVHKGVLRVQSHQQQMTQR